MVFYSAGAGTSSAASRTRTFHSTGKESLRYEEASPGRFRCIAQPARGFRPAGLCGRRSATHYRRASRAAAASGLGWGWRPAPLGRSPLYLGGWLLGESPAPRRGLGPWAQATGPRWLVLG